MKIFYCIDHLRPDGTQRVLAQLVEGLAARGHQQAVLCLSDQPDRALLERLHRTGTEVRILGMARLVAGWPLAATWRWMRRNRFDVAVPLLFVSDVLGRSLAKAAGVPRIVSSIRARNVQYPGWKRRLVRCTMQWSNEVILNSATVRDFAIAEEGAPPGHIHIIVNGVNVEDYAVPCLRDEVAREFGVPADRRMIGSIGRLDRQKGFDLLLEALRLLTDIDTHLLIVGEGKEERNLRAQAGRLGLADRVHFAGYRRDIPRLLNAFDLYVQPSRFEGMPNALLEAMAAGRPVVASRVDGVAELIVDGIHGWLVAPENPVVLARSIAAALANTVEAKRCGQAARKRASEEFSVRAMVDAWEAVLTGDTPLNDKIRAPLIRSLASTQRQEPALLTR